LPEASEGGSPMWRKHLALALVLAAILVTPPSTAGAWGSRVVVVAPPHGSVFFVAPRHHFVHPRFFVQPFVATPFIVAPVVPSPFIAVRPIWVPGFWSWNGVQWVWVADHWR
jgi:hypothetical protein